MENHKEGSKWRKWNLHLHSKYSLEKTTKMEIKDIFEKAIEKKLSMIAITDHSNVDGLDEIWGVYENDYIELNGNKKKIKELIEFLPGIELCTDKGQSGVHIVVIFPKEIKINNNLIKATKRNVQENFCNLLGLTEAKISEAGDGKYKNGLLNIKVNLDEAVKLAHDIGGKVIIHGGDKHKSIENEMTHEKTNDPNEVYKHLGMQKTEIISKKIDLIEIPNRNRSSLNNVEFYNNNFDKPCILCSDSHTEDDYDNDLYEKSTWVKADLSFEGFNHSIIDYKERIDISEIPKQLYNFENNKTKYIKELTINWEKNYDGKHGDWFKNFSVPLNYGLISIIGNKGSGKTALAEIISFICNTRRYDEFNFLTSKKFKLKHLSNNFLGEVLFYDEKTRIKKNLDENITPDAIEYVQFIPQNYFEKICNVTLNDQFSEELNRVVFERMKEEDKENAKSFKELVDKYKISINKDLSFQKNLLNEKNNNIIMLEKKQNMNYVNTCNNQLEKLNTEHEMTIKLKPIEVKLPKMKEDEIKKYNKYKEDIDNINKKIEDTEKLVLLNKNKMSEMNHLKNDFSNLMLRFNEEFKELEKKLIKFDIKKNDIISINFNDKIIEDKIIKISNENIEYNKLLNDDTHNKSLYTQKKEIQLEINNIIKDSQIALEKYEKYCKDLEIWEKKKIDLDEKKEVLEKEIDYITNDLQNDIKELRNERTLISKNIYDIKSKLVILFNKFKKPVDELILENNELLEEYNLQIKSGHFIKENFEDTFFNFINKTRKNVYKDSNYVILDHINNNYDMNECDSILKFLNETIEFLESDEKLHIHEQLKEKYILDFYDFIFGLDFLEEKYDLSTFNKSLDSLSPGERGALLLVFYLLIDDNDTPLILDQREDNLDNQSISSMLVPFIKKAKKHRQIIIVTHNPNISIVSDSDQIIFVSMDKKNNKISQKCGAIENNDIKNKIVEIQEGTEKSFKKREKKYNLK